MGIPENDRSNFLSCSYVLIFTYGILSGTGLGLIVLPVSVACNYYFEKKRALATGIAKTGFSLGGFIYPPTTDWVLENFDWKAVIYMYAGIAFISCFFGALIRPLEPVNSSLNSLSLSFVFLVCTGLSK